MRLKKTTFSIIYNRAAYLIQYSVYCTDLCRKLFFTGTSVHLSLLLYWLDINCTGRDARKFMNEHAPPSPLKFMNNYAFPRTTTDIFLL